MSDPIIIIGTGLAGYQVAKEFRRLDTNTPLILVTADDGRFYSKPLLSTALTSGKTSDTLATATADAMAKQLNATVKTHCRVTAIDYATQSIDIDEVEIPYSKLVLACGADVIRPPLKGNAVHEILSINHLHQYAAFQEAIQSKKRVTILGAGLIGCEFANDLSNAGFAVNVIAPAKAPLELLIPEAVGKILQSALENNGVKFHLQLVANEVNKTENGLTLTLSDGTTLETDCVLSAIGLVPHVELAKTAEIQTQRGILVNRYLETSVNGIYALGDCAEVEGHVLPYITPLLNCSRALAKTLAGERTPVEYPAMPVVVKTPAHPIAVCPPPKGLHGEWKIETLDNNTRALFYDELKRLCGFVLTNEAVKERLNLAKQLPMLF